MGKKGKVRVYQLAKELGTTSKKIIDVLEEMKIPIKNHMSTVEDVYKRQVYILDVKKTNKGPQIIVSLSLIHI